MYYDLGLAFLGFTVKLDKRYPVPTPYTLLYSLHSTALVGTYTCSAWIFDVSV